MNEIDKPGVVAHPPLIYLGFLALGFALDYVWPLSLADGWLPPRLRLPFAILLAVGGASLLALGIRRFLHHGTNFRTDKPSTAVISDGVYRYTRNPLYIGLSLIYAGIALALNSVWVLALLVPILAVIRYGVIAREEHYLERKFGEEYLRYKRSVRRWL